MSITIESYKKTSDPRAKEGVDVYDVRFDLDGSTRYVCAYLDREEQTIEYDDVDGLTEDEDTDLFCELAKLL